jgi:Family of unknown function (DUF6962)
VETETLIAATDYLLGASALGGAIGLFRRPPSGGNPARRLWAAGFTAIGAAAFLGGAWHARAAHLAPASADALWKWTLLAAGVGGFFFVAGAAFASLAHRPAVWTTAAAVAKLAAFALWAVGTDTFAPVVLDSALTLAALVLLQSYAFLRRRTSSAPWALGGCAVSALGAGVEALRPEFPLPLGPDAVYHLIQIVGLYLLYRAGRLFPSGPLFAKAQPSTRG